MAAREAKVDAQQFALISKALADPSRFEMLQKIGESKQAPTCSCIRDWLHLSPATISHHLKELESAGLVRIERNGKFAHISLRRDVLKAYLHRLSSI
jgi:ArsR family transcriptional regulator